MLKRKFTRLLPVLDALAATACRNSLSSEPGTAPTAARYPRLRSLIRRILDTPMVNLALIRTAYASRLREKLLRAVTSDPYDGGFDYDYVYDTQDDRPVATTVGPGRIAGRRIIVPVDMRYTHLRPKHQS
jgi:hypothetical protein